MIVPIYALQHLLVQQLLFPDRLQMSLGSSRSSTKVLLPVVRRQMLERSKEKKNCLNLGSVNETTHLKQHGSVVQLLDRTIPRINHHLLSYPMNNGLSIRQPWPEP